MNSNENQQRAAPPARQAGALGVATTASGAALLATAAGACCVPVIAPLIVAVLGVSGAAWAAGLKAYSPYILSGSLALLLYGFWTVYRRRPVCETGGTCPPASPGRSSVGVRIVLWVAAALWTGSAIINLFFST